MRKTIFFITITAILMFFCGNALASLNTHSGIFNGTNYISITNTNQNSLGITGSMTIKVNINIDSNSSSNSQAIISKYDSAGSQRGYIFGYKGTSGDGESGLFLYISSTGSNISLVNAETILPAEMWKNVGVVYNAKEGSATFFVNNTQIGTKKTGLFTSIFNNSAPVNIGSFGNGNYLFYGKIDDLRLWDIAKTATEFAENSDSELSGNETNLQLYMKFNEEIIDSSINANVFSNVGGITFSTDVPFVGTSETTTEEDATSEETQGTSTEQICACTGELVASKTVAGILVGSAVSTTSEFINVGYDSEGNYATCIIDTDGNTLSSTIITELAGYTVKNVSKKTSKSIAILAYINGAGKIFTVDYSTTTPTVTSKTF